MNQDSFKELEALFHELSLLTTEDRVHRLEDLGQRDEVKAAKLRSMFDSITHEPGFLEPEAIEQQVQQLNQVPVDGSAVLAGRYTLVECIGVGGSSTVFRARATNPGRDVAIKMLRFGLSSQRARDRFEEESKSLAKLTHPHIAHIYETGVFTLDEVQVPWIAMELMPASETMIDRIEADGLEQDGLDQAKRVGLFVRVCEAIEAAHRAGVLHLDLNRSNILVDSHGYPKIIDFGLAGLAYWTSTKRTSFVGTRYSMAPEQTLFGSVPFDERTDVYALGLLFVEFLVGRRLQEFEGQRDEDARKLIAMGKAREQLVELEGITDKYRLVIDKMLRVDPMDRFARVGDVLKAIEAVSGEPTKVNDRRQWWPWAAVPACLGLIVSGVYFGIPPSEEVPEPGHSSLESSGALSLPPEVVLEISSQNPRNEEYSASDEQVIDGISTALDSTLAEELDPTVAAALHASLADTYRVSGSYEDAIEQYVLTIGLLKEPGVEADRNWQLLSLAELLLFLGRAEEAQVYLDKIVRSKALEPLFLLDLGIAESQVHVILNEHDRALKQIRYTAELSISFTDGDIGERVDRMITMGELLIELSQHDEGVKLLHQARAQAVSGLSEESVSLAFIDVSLANALFNRELIATSTQAKERILFAINTFTLAGDEFHAIWASRQLGNIYLAIGDAQSAFELYERAYSQMGDLLGEVHHETIVCLAYRELAQIAMGGDIRFHGDAFESAMSSLELILGNEHAVVWSIREAEERLYSD